MSHSKQYTIDGVVSLAIPDGTTARYEDDDTIAILSLPGVPTTEILIGLFPQNDGRLLSPVMVRERLADFIERCVGGVAGVKAVRIEPVVDVEDNNVCAWQAVAEIEEDQRWWLARLYGRLGGSHVLLVHWNGPRAQMESVVLESFASIAPLFARDSGATAS